MLPSAHWQPAVQQRSADPFLAGPQLRQQNLHSMANSTLASVSQDTKLTLEKVSDDMGASTTSKSSGGCWSARAVLQQQQQ
jgi:hypothetical protein